MSDSSSSAALSQTSAVARAPREPIAIVGMGCRFAGGAHDPATFWKVICEGLDVFTDVPKDRWDLRSHYDADTSRRGKMHARQGAFLRQPIDQFDTAFFGISPREAGRLDPHQRLLLEVAWEAFEDAGIVPATLAGSRTGVFVGGFFMDMVGLMVSPLNRDIIDSSNAAGASLTLLSERLSYTWDLRGPSLSLDTACSSSLVAFHYACMSIWEGESTMALAGGATVMIRPETSITLSKGGFLSPDARCKAFDARANGYARGEGAGVVVLKPLSAALADGNPIYALVRGTACNQDGRTPGITVPRAEAQVALIREACQRAGISPGQIQYVEAHGTGTSVGDPIEASALGTALRAERSSDAPCLIGSVKTLLGHTEASAGIAGVIKAALCLDRQRIPPNLHFETPNPSIDFQGLRLRVPTSLEPWPAHEGPALAGVNSFGFGGTNAHAVLSEAPPRVEAPRASAPGPFLLPLSAQGEPALQALARAWLEFLAPDSAGAEHALVDLCRAAGAHRTHFSHRLALVAGTVEELRDQLAAYLAGESRPGMAEGRVGSAPPRLAFVYSGMGPQWWAMGREMLDSEPIFREVVERCSAALEPLGGWSLLEILRADEASSRIAETQFAQTANFAVQAGLTALLEAWGVQPDVVIGHSVGEVSSAYASGALDFEDAVRVSFHRSKAQSRAAGLGQMLATGLSATEAEEVARRWQSRISLAAINGPTATTLAGDPEALAEVARELDGRGVFQRFLRVDIAYHSHHMDPLREEILEALSRMTPREPSVPLLSTVTGAPLSEAGMDAEYWWRNVREPVRFAPAIQQALAREPSAFLEIGPHPVLSGSITECLDAAGRKVPVISTLSRNKPERRRLLEALARLYVLGTALDWEALAPSGRFVRLPTYPWQREVFWAESAVSRADRLGPQGHPLLGQRLPTPEPTWEAELNRFFVPYAEDHQVEGTPVLPGAAYVEAALAADRELAGEGPCILRDIRILNPLLLARGDAPRLRLRLEPETGRFTLHSREFDERAPWKLHSTGTRLSDRRLGEPERIDLEAIQARCRPGPEAASFYAHLAEARGLTYGPTFQGVRRLWVGQDETLTELVVPEALGTQPEDYRLHPAVLDASFHGILALLPAGTREVFLPVAIESMRFHASPGRHFWCHSTRSMKGTDSLEGDIRLCDSEGRVLAEVKGMLCRRLDRSKGKAQVDRMYLASRWHPRELPAVSAEALPSGGGVGSEAWLILGGRTGLGGALAEACTRAGVTPVLVERGADFQRLGAHTFQVQPEEPAQLEALIRAVGKEYPGTARVVDLWAMEAQLPASGMTPEAGGAIERALMMRVALARVLRDARWARMPRLWIALRGSEPVNPRVAVVPTQSALSGLTKVLRSEVGHLRCSIIDLEPGTPATPEEEARWLSSEISADTEEDAVSIRAGKRFVQRWEYLVPEEAGPRREAAADGEPCRLEGFSTPGAPGLVWRECERAEPGPGEVALRVRSWALGARASGEPAAESGEASVIGLDCVGTVVAVGAGVQELSPGDEVAAILGASVGSFVTVPASHVIRRPGPLQAPGLGALVIAYDVLMERARLRPGETLVVHGAASPLGLAMVQVARSVGVRVWAASTMPEGLELLARVQGVEPIDARVATWGDAILRGTGGRGADVVVSALVSAGAEECARVLARRGRWGMACGEAEDGAEQLAIPLRPGLAVFTFDPEQFFSEQRERLPALLREVSGRIEKGALVPPVLREFLPGRVQEAATHLATPEPAGGALLRLEGQQVLLAPGARALFKPDASYLITGGLSGFGLAVASLMVDHGARHLVLVGRSGASTEEARQGVAELERRGARVWVAKADVSSEEQVGRLFEQLRRELPPLRGVMHSAVVLDDCAIDQLTDERMHRVFGPKVLGAWNLHRATAGMPLDHFVLFSSASAFTGSAGQANYVAANTFLDGMAHYRRSQGLTALAVNWGLIADTGLAARFMRKIKDLKINGMNGQPVAWMTAALGRMLRADVTHMAFFDLDGDTIEKLVPHFWETPRFSLVDPAHPRRTKRAARATVSLHDELLTASSERRVQLLTETLQSLAADVLGMERARLDVEQPLTLLGMDSVMAGQLKVSIERATGVPLPVVQIVAGPSVSRLVELTLAHFDMAPPAPPGGVVGAVTAAAPGIEAVAEPVSGERIGERA